MSNAAGPDFVSPHPGGTAVTVWVVPGASRDALAGPHADALKVRVTAPAEGGRANGAVAALLTAAAGADGAELLAGRTARRKRFLLLGVTPSQVLERLGAGREQSGDLPG